MLIAGLLFVFHLKDLFQMRRDKDKENLLRRNVLSMAVVGLGFLLTVLYVYPPSDLSFAVGYSLNPMIVLVKGILIASTSLVGNTSSVFSMIVGGSLFLVILLHLLKQYKPMKPMLILVIILTVFISIIHFNFYHAGILYITFISALWIFGTDEFFQNIKLKKKTLMSFALLCIAIAQIYWSVCSVKNDISANYSAAQETASYLEENMPENGTVYGLGVWATAIEPYFESNIFDNYNSEKAFYWWSDHNGYMSTAEMLAKRPDIVVVSIHEKEDFEQIIAQLNAQGYKSKSFYGSIFMKDTTWSEEGFTVYLRV